MSLYEQVKSLSREELESKFLNLFDRLKKCQGPEWSDDDISKTFKTIREKVKDKEKRRYLRGILLEYEQTKDPRLSAYLSDLLNSSFV